MHHVHLRQQLEQLARQMQGRAETGRRVEIFSRVAAKQFDQLGHRAGRQAEMAHQKIRQRPDVGHESEVLGRIEGQLAGLERRRDRARGNAAKAQRVAVGLGPGDRFHADIAATAAVFDDELLTGDLAHLHAEQPRQRVGGAAGGIRIDVAHRPGRPGRLGPCRAADDEGGCQHTAEYAKRGTAIAAHLAGQRLALHRLVLLAVTAFPCGSADYATRMANPCRPGGSAVEVGVVDTTIATLGTSSSTDTPGSYR